MGFEINGATLSSTASGNLTLANGATTWMNITPAGMNFPQKPAFHAEFGSQGNYYQVYPVNPTGIWLNKGNCWSAGYFTCPVAGRYLVSMNGLACSNASGAGSNGYFGINKNGVLHAFGHWNEGGYYTYSSISCIINCVAGDNITFAINSAPAPVGAAFNGWYAGGGHGSFTIVLVN